MIYWGYTHKKAKKTNNKNTTVGLEDGREESREEVRPLQRCTPLGRIFFPCVPLLVIYYRLSRASTVLISSCKAAPLGPGNSLEKGELCGISHQHSQQLGEGAPTWLRNPDWAVSLQQRLDRAPRPSLNQLFMLAIRSVSYLKTVLMVCTVNI